MRGKFQTTDNSDNSDGHPHDTSSITRQPIRCSFSHMRTRMATNSHESALND